MRGLLIPTLILPLLLGTAGCSYWDVGRAEEKPWQMTAPRMSPDTVVLEVAFIRSTPGNHQEVEQLWREIDEQMLPTELRWRLSANGIRCGVLGTQVPAVIQQLLAQETSLALDSPEFQQQDHDVTSRQYRLQSREGHRTTIATGADVESIHVFLNDEGVVRGHTFHKAQCVFGLRSFAQGDGRVRIELLPEIEHGEPRNRRIGSEGVWRLEFSRDRETYDGLRIEALLAPGQTFLVSCTPERVGLGSSFFAKTNQEASLLLVRVAQTQKDELFETARERTPIATTGE